MTATTTAIDPSVLETPIANSGGTVNAVGVIVADPTLGALADNGGPTLTHLPLLGSPAIDGGSDAAAVAAGLTVDQRGQPRFLGTVDIGAVEVEADLSLTKSVDDPQPPVGAQIVFTVTVSNGGPIATSGSR
jgi:hypothetical protein